MLMAKKAAMNESGSLIDGVRFDCLKGWWNTYEDNGNNREDQKGFPLPRRLLGLIASSGGLVYE